MIPYKRVLIVIIPYIAVCYWIGQTMVVVFKADTTTFSAVAVALALLGGFLTFKLKSPKIVKSIQTAGQAVVANLQSEDSEELEVEESPEVTESQPQAFCVGCRKKTTIKNSQTTQVKGKSAITGTCSDCGRKVFTFVKPSSIPLPLSSPNSTVTDSTKHDLEQDLIAALIRAVSTATVKEGTVISINVDPSADKKLSLGKGRIDFLIGNTETPKSVNIESTEDTSDSLGRDSADAMYNNPDGEQ